MGLWGPLTPCPPHTVEATRHWGCSPWPAELVGRVISALEAGIAGEKQVQNAPNPQGQVGTRSASSIKGDPRQTGPGLMAVTVHPPCTTHTYMQGSQGPRAHMVANASPVLPPRLFFC